MGSKFNEIIKQVDACDIISFDIFDTLVLRNVLFPKDIFKLLSEYVKNEYKIENFYKIRINSEIKARKNTENEDITIYEIYDIISEKLNLNCIKIMEKEIELEKRFIIENPFMKKVFSYAISKNKKIFLISDMYLPKKIIQPILEELGYVGYDDIYVSGDIKKTKATKTMYKYLIKYKAFDPQKWLHIGDNMISDVKNPQDFKINTYYYEAIRDKAEEIDESIDIKTSIMKALQYNLLYTDIDFKCWEKIGIQYVGPILYGFSDWIIRTNKLCEKDIFEYIYTDTIKLSIDLITTKRNLNGIKLNLTYQAENNNELMNLKTFRKYFEYDLSENNKKFINENISMYDFIFISEKQKNIDIENTLLSSIKLYNDDYILQMQKSAIKMIRKFIEYDEFITGISVYSVMEPYINFIKKRRYDDFIKFYEIQNHLLDMNECTKYVSMYDKAEIISNYKKVLNICKSNLWPYAFIIDGIDDENNFELFMKSNKIYKNSFLKQYSTTLKKVYRKIIKFIKRKLRKIFNLILRLKI